MQHIKGTLNVCADMLSRLGAKNSPSNGLVLPDDDDRVIVAAISEIQTPTVNQVAVATDQSPDLSKVRQYIQSGWPAKSHLQGVQRQFERNSLCRVPVSSVASGFVSPRKHRKQS